MWLRIYQHLLPTALAWVTTIGKKLRQFFEGLTGLPTDIERFIDEVWADLDPTTTRQLSLWQTQFNLDPAGQTTEQQREALDAAWKATGGQSLNYIQTTLRNAGFDVYVHEWFEDVPGRPGGGSVNGDVTPTARNPNTYINDGIIQYNSADGVATMQDGNAQAQDGDTDTANGYLLVNKILDNNGDPVTYTIPGDSTKWPYFFYIGGQTFPNLATIPTSRRGEFESLVLKISPTEQWIGILAEFN